MKKDMFSTISWHGFATTVLIATGLYYTTVLAAFYRHDILDILRNGLPRYRNRIADNSPQESTGEPELFAGINDLLEDLDTVFRQAAEKRYPREELLQALRSCLKQYRQLKDTPFEAAANDLMIRSAASQCDTVLEQNDVRRLW